LYFFIVNVFVSEIFRGLKLKFIVHKNCQSLNRLSSVSSQTNLTMTLANYLKVMNSLFKKLNYHLKTSTKINNMLLFVTGVNFYLVEEPAVEDFDENLYLTNYLIIVALNDLKNEI
jgi:hypothetical protein